MLRRGIKIRFAHRTFSWESEARGAAHVHVVIIGFGTTDAPVKRIYDYEHDANTPTVITAKNISPYLVDGPNAVIVNRSTPLCAVPEMVTGNKPIDDGNYLFTPDEKQDFVRKQPNAAPYFRRWLGGEEFINGIERWILWLAKCPPEQLHAMPECLKRVEAVRAFRAASKSQPTQKIAVTPTRFHTQFLPSAPYLALPQVSSERRRYIPVAYLTTEYMAGDKLRVIAQAGLYHFGMLTSAMHMAWVNRVTGRLKSDYQYSGKLVYNNYPWPQSPSDKQRGAVEVAAQGVLDARAKRPGASLAALYDPLTMPADLTKAHQALDRAVDLCYRPQKFDSDRARVEFLFELYEQLTTPLTAEPKPSRRRKNADPPPDGE